ncbi:MAG: (d)CMP kinase [Thermoplasmataceae archaeon]
MRITISGTIGSGKSTVASILSRMTGYKVFSGGYFFRKAAEDHGMTVEEFNRFLESDPTFDTKLNNNIKKFLSDNDNIIVESRLIGWLSWRGKIPAFRVFLDADIDERVRRVQKRDSSEETKNLLLDREESEIKRFREFFEIDFSDKRIYDLVLNTDSITAEEASRRIYDMVNANR